MVLRQFLAEQCADDGGVVFSFDEYEPSGGEQRVGSGDAEQCSQALDSECGVDAVERHPVVAAL